MMKIQDSIIRMKCTVCFTDGMSKQTLDFYVNILNDSPFTAVINLAAEHLDNSCTKFLALNLWNQWIGFSVEFERTIIAFRDIWSRIFSFVYKLKWTTDLKI